MTDIKRDQIKIETSSAKLEQLNKSINLRSTLFQNSFMSRANKTFAEDNDDFERLDATAA